MKVVAYDGLMEAAMGIQQRISWLMAQFLSNQVFYTDAKKAGSVLEDLQVRFSKLYGHMLQMEADATEIDIEAGASVFVFTTEDAVGWDNAVDALRDVLAETIVGAGEYRLEKEAKNAAAYGDALPESWGKGLKALLEAPLEQDRLEQERLEKNDKIAAIYGRMCDVMDKAHTEMIANSMAEDEALAVLKAVCAEYERQYIGCDDCVSDCATPNCLYEDVPDIDADGHLFD